MGQGSRGAAVIPQKPCFSHIPPLARPCPFSPCSPFSVSGRGQAFYSGCECLPFLPHRPCVCMCVSRIHPQSVSLRTPLRTIPCFGGSPAHTHRFPFYPPHLPCDSTPPSSTFSPQTHSNSLIFPIFLFSLVSKAPCFKRRLFLSLSLFPYLLVLYCIYCLSLPD